MSQNLHSLPCFQPSSYCSRALAWLFNSAAQAVERKINTMQQIHIRGWLCESDARESGVTVASGRRCRAVGQQSLNTTNGKHPVPAPKVDVGHVETGLVDGVAPPATLGSRRKNQLVAALSEVHVLKHRDQMGACGLDVEPSIQAGTRWTG